MATWSEDATQIYQALAHVAVPERELQMALLIALLPYGLDDTFRIVELGCGEGRLAQALLQCYPHAGYLGLDGSEGMRHATQQRLAAFGARGTVASFDLLQEDWHAQVQGTDVLLSSLCIHHLSDSQKQRLFMQIVPLLSARGALLLADLVSAPRPQVARIFAAQWDRAAALRSLEQTGGLEPYQLFVREEWNHYRFPDPVDQPSSLFAQLRWLADAGLAEVECFWMQAGHAVYGGYRAPAQPDAIGVPLPLALASAVTALSTPG